MAMATVNGETYHYQIHGESGTTPQHLPLVLLHGFTGSGANWQELSMRLAPSMQVITIDLLGHGQTAAPPDPQRYTMAQSAQDVVDLLATVTTMPVNLLGYSMGGRLALYLALTYPQRINKLILESASPGLADAEARRARIQSDEALATQIGTEGITAFVEHWERIPLFASQEALSASTQQRLRAQRLRNRPRGLANSLRGMGTGVQPALWGQLALLNIPTLLLTGELDTKFCEIAQQMVTKVPNARHLTIAQAGHTIHLEQTEAFVQTISTFLRN